jgi:hypothetical protein
MGGIEAGKVAARSAQAVALMTQACSRTKTAAASEGTAVHVGPGIWD